MHVEDSKDMISYSGRADVLGKKSLWISIVGSLMSGTAVHRECLSFPKLKIFEETHLEQSLDSLKYLPALII